MNGIRDALVCGHSDCKAMHALLSAASWAEGEEEESPLRAWIARDTCMILPVFKFFSF